MLVAVLDSSKKTLSSLFDLTFSWRLALMMEAVSTSETSASFYQTTRRNIPEYRHLKVTFLFTKGNKEFIEIQSTMFPLLLSPKERESKF
jgi:hypothetical protein